MVERGTEPDSVLVPVDDSPLSDDALEYAIEHHPNAEIIALHVLDIWEKSYTVPEQPGGFPGEYWENVEEYSRDQAEAILEEAEQVAEEHGVEIRTEMQAGQVARTLVEYVEEEDVDVVILGSHGRTGVGRLLLGSVAEKVMRQAPCPVTVVR